MNVPKKELTPENIIEGVQTLKAHFNEPFPKLKATLESNGFGWTHEDFLAMNEDRIEKGLESADQRLFIAISDGELSMGAGLVAHAQQSPEELNFMRDKTMLANVDTWLKKVSEREGVSLEDHGPKDLNLDNVTPNERKLITSEPIRVVWKEVDSPDNAQKDTHNVVFAYAHDRDGFVREGAKEIGLNPDDAVKADRPNPYMVNRKQNGEIRHDVQLNQEMFDRLQAYSGKGDGQWQGCIETVQNPASLEKGRHIPDLTKSAEELGVLRKPDSDFQEEYHDAFVKDSLVALREKRRLPQVSSPTGPETEDQFGA